MLREVAGGLTLASDPEADDAVRRLLSKPRTPPLSQAQAECLAIVAYLQPVSRPEIARIRGVNSDSPVSTLEERGLIEEKGRTQFGAILYRTTPLFEKLFGLESLEGAARHQDVRAERRGRAAAARQAAEGRRAARELTRSSRVGRRALLAGDRGDVRRDRFGFLAGDDVGRHRAGARAAVLDRAQHRALSGLSWSRFGPTWPLVPASASVWQVPQDCVKICLPSAIAARATAAA